MAYIQGEGRGQGTLFPVMLDDFVHRGIRSATSITIDFGAIFPFTVVLACKPPCLRFAMAVTGHHARLGTRLRARLCRGLHFRRLNSMSFQGTTLGGSDLAEFERFCSLRRRYQWPGKRQLMAIRITHVKVTFAPTGIPRLIWVESLLFEMTPR